MSIAGLAKLKSLYFGHGLLDWAIVALPHLHTLSLGDSAMVQLPTDDSSALYITSSVIGNCRALKLSKMSAIVDLLRRLPNLGSLELERVLSSRTFDTTHGDTPPTVATTTNPIFAAC